ncbi:hypothetical protein QUF99_14640 [Bacillus sp. DX4.1]|uniref:hypothetical protein n=1 Tax=Bacillus sp. DX4.1 TaxID=3055867 RepID=UPI0025A2386C|nr:hypothetical protein [Bacillus sp. DX4.1]MDM5188508.1 hypothetical protein [Bacillus sp. DX4.1]
MKEKRSDFGILSFTIFVMSIVTLGVYLFAGNSVINDEILIFAFGITFILSFILAFFSRNNKFGQITLFSCGSLLGLIVVFYMVMPLLWNKP